MKTNNLTLSKSENFNGLLCNLWKGADDDLYMTREQVGQALGYEDANNAIARLHRRHKHRLDKYSMKAKLPSEGGEQSTVVYNIQGILEVCRWSEQSTADDFIDWAWHVMYKVITRGDYKISEEEYRRIGLKFAHDKEKQLSDYAATLPADMPFADWAAACKQHRDKLYGYPTD